MSQIISDEERIKRLILDIDSASKSIRIVSGEANYEIYNNEDVVTAFRNAKKRGVDIKIMIGPIIEVPEDGNDNMIVKLSEENVLEIYYRPERRTLIHYRIVDKHVFYAEEPHPPLSPPSERRVMDIMDINDKEFWINKMIADFDARISEREVLLSKREDFIMLKPSQIQKLISLLIKEGESYDFITKDVLKEIANRLN